RRGGVALVRVVEDGGLGGTRRAQVVVTRDGVQQFGAHLCLEGCGPALDQPQAEVDVAEQPTFGDLPKCRSRPELDGTADVVEERGRDKQVAAQPWMQLGSLAAEGRNADRVLEQSACIRVM